MAKKKKSKTVDAVDPKACPNYDGAKESVAKHYQRLLPRCYTGAAKPAQVAATKEVNYLVLLGKIATTVLSDPRRRRFILRAPAPMWIAPTGVDGRFPAPPRRAPRRHVPCDKG